MQVTIEKFPANSEEFKAMPQADLKLPENTCVMFLCALELFLKDKEEGTEAMNYLRGPVPMTPYDIQFLRDRLRDKAYLPKAYFDGAKPENNYRPAKPYVLCLTEDTHPREDGFMKLFVKTAGADSPRPITLRRKDDTWFLWEYSSMLSGIKIPKADDPWA